MRRTMLIMLMLPVLLAGCAREQVRQPRGDEQVLPARVGESVTVTLAANPTTGYQWQLVSPASALVRFVARDFVAATPGRIGGGGTETWRFATIAPGTVFLDFAYVRPWETGVEPVQRQTVLVEIVP
ncbi:MAG TPA: protease inhibitor I42 family protein [bacterium]|nr:protease inhibitor I42 family protein [bacterium]